MLICKSISWMRYSLYIMAILLAASCARRSSPSGGEKDSIPPVLIASNPKINSVNFNSDEIRLTFDEWVKLDNLDKQLIISPPLEKKKYEVKPLGGITKKIFVNFLDSLAENTTYTFNFGNSIVDNNEGNKMNFFSYTFSTGPTLDSLYLKGNVQDAFNLETEEYLSLQLYRIDSTYNDSIIFNNQPTYLANTLDSTAYRFNNLREGRYILIALKDIADAINVTDSPGAKVHMSALTAAIILAQNDIDPILQLTVRDRNRLAIQGDLVGASALGVHNILCLSGDDPKVGDQPETKAAKDIDSATLVTTANMMRKDKKFPSGRVIDPAPN